MRKSTLGKSVTQKSDKLLRAYRTYARILHKAAFLGGCLYNSTVSHMFTYVFASLSIVTSGIQVTLLLLLCYKKRNDLAIMMKVIGRITSCFATCLKAGSLLIKHEKVVELHNLLNNYFEEELVKGEETKLVLFFTLYGFCIPTYMYFSIVVLTLSSFLGLPFINIFRQIIHLQLPTNYGLFYNLPYPWPISNNLVYFMHFLYELSSSWFLIFTTWGVDGMFYFYAYQFSSILRAMSHTLSDPRSKKDFPTTLKMCMEKHRQLMRCRDNLESIYGPIIVWVTLTNAVLMCSLLFEALPFTDFTFHKFITFFPYMMLKLMQTFMYAWYSSAISHESEQFRQGIYFSKWPEYIAERGTRARMIIMLMQKPLVIKALTICTASIEMFTSVMNTTISYFFLLQTLDK